MFRVICNCEIEVGKDQISFNVALVFSESTKNLIYMKTKNTIRLTSKHKKTKLYWQKDSVLEVGYIKYVCKVNYWFK